MLSYAELPDELANGSEEDAKKVRRYAALNGYELTEMLQVSHARILRHLQEMRTEDPSYTITAIPGIPQVLMTRRLQGCCTMNADQSFQRQDDSIGMMGNWRKAGPIYEIPFGALHCSEIDNLYVAGRCISAEDPMWDLTRVIPVCAVTGEAAGEAAAMKASLGSVSLPQLQQRLRRNGVRLHTDEVL